MSPGKPLFTLLLLVALMPFGGAVHAQQVADTQFRPTIARPAFAAGKGPIVLLDEAHHNFHTASGRYQAFADLLRRDGYVVKPSATGFSPYVLESGSILVIANALHESNEVDWSPPNPSAFSDAEIAAVRGWVSEGGLLLLIADHLPFPGAAEKLAAAFGIHYNNGYATEPDAPRGPLVFARKSGALLDHPVTRGRAPDERVDAIATFGGSAFQIDQGEPLIRFSDAAIAFMPKVFGQAINADTPKTPVKGWLQGAVLRVGKGRVAVFGEAAMFSAQLTGPDKEAMGMNAPIAGHNPQFLLNVMHWLSGLLDEQELPEKR